MSFEGFIIGEQDENGFSDITCLKCVTTLSTLTKHMDIIEALYCGSCGHKAIKGE